MVIDKDLLMYAFIGFIFIIIISSGGSNTQKNTSKNKNEKEMEKLYNKIIKENRNLEGLSIKVAEIENEIEVLRYEGDEDLEKADINDLKIRKLRLKIQHLEEKIFQKKIYIQDLEKEINSLR